MITYTCISDCAIKIIYSHLLSIRVSMYLYQEWINNNNIKTQIVATLESTVLQELLDTLLTCIWKPFETKWYNFKIFIVCFREILQYGMAHTHAYFGYFHVNIVNRNYEGTILSKCPKIINFYVRVGMRIIR